MKALVETCLHDAEDLGLTLPYEQINVLLLAACKDVEAASTDQVLVLGGSGGGARRVAIRPPRPGIEGCLLHGDNTLAGLITRAGGNSRVAPLAEPTNTLDRKKTLYLGIIALFAIVSGHQHAASHTNDTLARQHLMLALTQLGKLR